MGVTYLYSYEVYTACIRSYLLYGCEKWAMRAELESKMEMTEMRMIRWMWYVSLKERQHSSELGIEATGDVMGGGD